MSKIEIKKVLWEEFSEWHQHQLKSVFWEAAHNNTSELSNDLSRKCFFDRWLGNYLKASPITFLFCAFQEQNIIGYCVGTSSTNNFYGAEVPPMEQLFSEHWIKFPAHLHINLSAKNQGAGVGSRLIKAVKRLLSTLNSTGVAIITSPDSHNVSFYRKNGFTHEFTKHLNDHPLLFMGCHCLPENQRSIGDHTYRDGRPQNRRFLP